MYLQRASIYLSLESVSGSIIKEHQQMHHQSESIDLLLDREHNQMYHQRGSIDLLLESVNRCITESPYLFLCNNPCLCLPLILCYIQTHPFRVQFSLNPWYNTSSSNNDIIDIGEHFSKSSKLWFKFDVIIVKDDTQYETRVFIRNHRLLKHQTLSP